MLIASINQRFLRIVVLEKNRKNSYTDKRLTSAKTGG